MDSPVPTVDHAENKLLASQWAECACPRVTPQADAPSRVGRESAHPGQPHPAGLAKLAPGRAAQPPSHSPPPARARTHTTITLASGEKFTPDPRPAAGSSMLPPPVVPKSSRKKRGAAEIAEEDESGPSEGSRCCRHAKPGVPKTETASLVGVWSSRPVRHLLTCTEFIHRSTRGKYIGSSQMTKKVGVARAGLRADVSVGGSQMAHAQAETMETRADGDECRSRKEEGGGRTQQLATGSASPVPDCMRIRRARTIPRPWLRQRAEGRTVDTFEARTGDSHRPWRRMWVCARQRSERNKVLGYVPLLEPAAIYSSTPDEHQAHSELGRAPGVEECVREVREDVGVELLLRGGDVARDLRGVDARRGGEAAQEGFPGGA
ncbi:hypothetical protein B0H17DRAFT_1272458 [Mycena rosella]|uniref:Uncharacterized protein n=1 Tax=Mycena rosella TaxID=1033263 RepID=A0AAD7CDG9_MYCRO|nr:hypothetical protein B0H17DRAFT_1272458 [Mycena rosella]